MHKKLHIYKLLIFLLFIVLSNNASAQTDSLLYDTDGKIEVRTSDKAAALRDDSAFDYDRKFAKPPVGWLERLFYWLMKFFRAVDEGGPVAWLFYGVLIVVVFIILSQLLGFKYDALLLRNKNLKSNKIEVFDEDIHNLDINQIISDALSEQNYRKAVRYAYLKLLKILDNNELIDWQPDKTNRDYHREMSKSRFKNDFQVLTRTYEYVWYGEFNINQDQFNHSYSVFKKVYKALNEK